MGFQLKRRKVLYTKNKDMKYGRVYCNKGLSLFMFRKEIRHTLCKDNYVDIDIENCHPTIISHICNKNNIKCDKLDKYIKDRNNIINDVIKTYEIKDNEEKTARAIIKNLFLSLMLGGKFQWFLIINNIDYEDIKHKPITKFIEEYEIQMNNIKEIIIKNNPDLKKEVIECKKKQKIKKYNLENTMFSLYLQEYENLILECIYNYCCENKYISNNNCILCYDGIMIQKKNYKEKLLNELIKHINAKLDININLVVKEMTDYYTNEKIEKEYFDRFNFKPEKRIILE
jgi:hypothetical protein